MKPDIYHVQNIGEGSLSVMAKPVSGEWIEDEFKNIANAGIHRIVSLLERAKSYEVGLSNEKILTKKNGMEFINYPIKDKELRESLNEYIELVNRLYQGIESGINTVIHCRAGIGRTGMVAAGILLRFGLSPEEAFDQISTKRRVTVPDTQEQIDWICNKYTIIINK